MKKILALLFGFLVFLIVLPSISSQAREAPMIDKTLIVDVFSTSSQAIPFAPVMSYCINDLAEALQPVTQMIPRSLYIPEAPDTPVVRKYLNNGKEVKHNFMAVLILVESRYNSSSRFD